MNNQKHTKRTAGQIGGRATLARYGPDHMRTIGRRGAATFWRRYSLAPVGLSDFAIVRRETNEVISVHFWEVRKMSAIRITKKLRATIEILSDETKADCSEQAFITALQKGRLKPQELYKAMSTMRYTWSAKRGYWIWRPRHMKSIQRIFAIARKFDAALFVEAAL